MSSRVLKFGGSCMSDPEGIRRIGEILSLVPGKKAVVLSAIKDSTDLLKSYLEERSRSIISDFRMRHSILASELLTEPSDREAFEGMLEWEMGRLRRLLDEDDEAVPLWVREHAITYGERLSVGLVCLYLNRMGIVSVPMSSEEAGIAAVGEFGTAEADLERTGLNVMKKVIPAMEDGKVPVITGFYGVLEDGRTATFGRNGSDYLAAVIARSVQASELLLYKDVKGFMSADPAIVPDAYMLDEITFEEGIELSHFGAKVLHPRTFSPLVGSGIPIRVLNMSDGPSGGTRMIGSREGPGDIVSLASRDGVSLIVIDAGKEAASILCAAYGVLSSRGIFPYSVSSSDGSVGIVLDPCEGPRAMLALEEAGIRRIRIDEDLAMIGIVGGRLRGDPSLLGRCLIDLIEGEIPVSMAGSGGTGTAYYLVVERMHLVDALRSLHRRISEGGPDRSLSSGEGIRLSPPVP